MRAPHLFLQYLNPEILSLYGRGDVVGNPNLLVEILRLTRYALAIAEGTLIIPSSYLFEIPNIDQFISEIRPVVDRGLLQFAGPTPDLAEYAQKKRHEYRDEPVLFPAYRDATSVGAIARGVLWRPRLEHTAFEDIAGVWKSELSRPRGLWSEVFERAINEVGGRLRKFEAEVAAVPVRLDERAFILRYVRPLVPVRMNSRENMKLGMMISRVYLESYLDEVDAAIIVDTRLGYLDCGVPKMSDVGRVRTVSWRRFKTLMDWVGLSNAIESAEMDVLVRVREDPNLRRIVDLALGDQTDPGMPFESTVAVFGSSFLVNPPPNTLYGLVEHMRRLLDVIEPRLPSVYSLSGAITVMFTDIVGSTALTERLGDTRAQEMLRLHNAVIRSQLKLQGGIEIKHTGDGIMAAFQDSSAAIDCAIGIQSALTDLAERSPESSIRVRIGLNRGYPIVEEADIFGSAVQLASRVCAAADAGQILVTDSVKANLTDEHLVRAIGAREFKGFSREVLVHEVIWQRISP